jgi:hypothetical protein
LRQACDRQRVGGAGEARIAAARGKRIAVHRNLAYYIVLN